MTRLMNTLNFIKMHGIGNDFVVFDSRTDPVRLDREQIRDIADRKTGVGCDQLIVIENGQDAHADAFMRIFNADGSQAQACGNATRCIASLIMAETGQPHAIIETVAGLLDAEAGTDGLVTVDMGPARLDWRDIPLAKAVDTQGLDVSSGPLSNPVAVNVGNPHAVFFVDDADAVDLEKHGPILEHDPMFPEFANIEVAHVLSDTEIRLRVWERGVGITRACGSGACATLVAAHRRGLTGRKASIHLDGGILVIEWLADGHVAMSGPVATSFSGSLNSYSRD